MAQKVVYKQHYSFVLFILLICLYMRPEGLCPPGWDISFSVKYTWANWRGGPREAATIPQGSQLMNSEVIH